MSSAGFCFCEAKKKWAGLDDNDDKMIRPEFTATTLLRELEIHTPAKRRV